MERKKLYKILIAVVIVALVWGLIWSWFITRTVRKNSKDNNMKNKHAIVKNIIVTETQEEKKYWEFYAQTGEYNSNNNSISLNDIIGNFYDKNEEVEISFKSKKGTYNEKTKQVVLNGDNLFVGKDGSQLYADKLIWQGRDKDILAEGNVQFIQTNKLIVKAQNATFNTDLTHFKAVGNTKTKVYSTKEEQKKYTQL